MKLNRGERFQLISRKKTDNAMTIRVKRKTDKQYTKHNIEN